MSGGYLDVRVNTATMGSEAFDDRGDLTAIAESMFKTVLGDSYRDRDSLAYRYSELIRDRKANIQARVIWTGEFIDKVFHICRIKYTDTYYVCSRFSQNKYLYRKYDDEYLGAMVAEWYRYFWGYSTGTAIKQMVDTVRANIRAESLLPSVERDYLLISNDLVWDRNKCDMIRVEELNMRADSPKIMVQLMSTSDPDKLIPQIPKFDEEQVKLMIDTYESHKGIPVDRYDMDLKPLYEWSEGVRGKYQDMLYAAATTISYPLPRFAFMFLGTGSNGKGAFTGLVGCMLGKDNTGNIKHEECMTWDHLYTVQTIMLNCPGETTNTLFSKDTENFKIMAAHESHTCKKKGSNSGINVKHEYMQFISENEMPTFGKDAKAVMNRLYPIRFSHDFSDNPIDDYAVKTFAEDKNFMPIFIGQVMALAHYYAQDGHKWIMSAEATAEVSTIVEYATPNVQFYKKFSMFISEYSKFSLVSKDYLNYGFINGEEYSPKDISKDDMLFSNYKHRVIDGKHRYVLNKGNGKIVLSDRFRSKTLTNNLTLDKFQEAGGSIISNLEAEYEECKALMERKSRNLFDKKGIKTTPLTEGKIILATLEQIARKDGIYGNSK